MRSEMYNKAMKDMFKQIPLTMINAIIPKQKVQEPITEIGGGWYMVKVVRYYHQ